MAPARIRVFPLSRALLSLKVSVFYTLGSMVLLRTTVLKINSIDVFVVEWERRNHHIEGQMLVSTARRRDFLLCELCLLFRGFPCVVC